MRKKYIETDNWLTTVLGGETGPEFDVEAAYKDFASSRYGSSTTVPQGQKVPHTPYLKYNSRSARCMRLPETVSAMLIYHLMTEGTED